MTFFEKLLYYPIYSLLKGISYCPLRLLYILSDCCAFILHSAVKYRRKVVHDNLATSFPDKNEREIRDIERKFYHFLTDYAFETIKLLSISKTNMKKRMVIENAEMVNDAVARGQSVVLYLGHYCNWEWVSSLPLWFIPEATSAQVYHHLHSKIMNRIFMKIRTRFHDNNIEMADIMRRLIEWKRQGKVSVTGLIADQCPKFEIHLFLDFLNHDTGVYTGPERISRFLDAEVLFCHLSRPKRGEYHLRFIEITSNPKKETTFDITRKYFEMLESNIKEAPQYWLWSHRRWKRTRADFYAHWGEHAEKMLSHL